MYKAGRLRLLLPIILYLVVAPLQAAPSLEDYGSLPLIQQVSVSPDGKKIAFRHTESGKEYDHYLSGSETRLEALRAAVNFVKTHLH